MMAPKDLTKNACIAFSQTIGEFGGMYRANKSAIDASLPWAPGVYTGALSVCYGVLSMPTKYMTKLFGTIGGGALNWLYVGGVMAPLQNLVSLLDFRTIKGMFATVYYVMKNCIPLAISKIFDYMINGLAEYFFAITKAVKGVAKVKSLAKRQMLTESKSVLMEGKIWDWFKGKMYNIAMKFKDAAWWLIKKGWSVIEKPFMKALYPITQCLVKNNKMRGLIKGNALSSGLGGKLVAGLGLTSLVTAGAATTVGLMIPAILGFMATFATVFTIAGYMNMGGAMLEFKNMVTDVFS